MFVAIDVKNVVFHGDFEDEVYVEAPLRFDKDCNNDFVCRLKKTLYGLRQSPRAWSKRFAKIIFKMKH